MNDIRDLEKQSMVRMLRWKIKRAWANYRRQRNREHEGKVVSVPSSFWQRAVVDYERELAKVEAS